MRRLLLTLALAALPAFAQAATVTVAGTTHTTTAGNKTVTATPAANDLIIVITNTSGVAGGTTAVSDNNSGGAGTYTLIGGAQRTQSTNSKRLGMWVRTALIVSGTSTVFTATQASSTGGGLTVLRVSGMSRVNGAAILQNAGQDEQAASSTPAPVFGATTDTNNVIIGAVVNGTNPATMTIPSGFAAEAADVGYATPNQGMHVVYRNSGFVGTTVTWGSTSANVYCDMVIELDTSAPASCTAGLNLPLLGVGGCP